MCRGFDPLFSLWQDRARSLWVIFSHPATPKRSFGVLKLPILTEFDLLGPKFHFSLNLFAPSFSGQRHTPISFRTEYRVLITRLKCLDIFTHCPQVFPISISYHSLTKQLSVRIVIRIVYRSKYDTYRIVSYGFKGIQPYVIRITTRSPMPFDSQLCWLTQILIFKVFR